MKVTVKIWIPSEPIILGEKEVVEKRSKKKFIRTALNIKVPTKEFQVEYEGSGQRDQAIKRVREKIKEFVGDCNDYGVLIY